MEVLVAIDRLVAKSFLQRVGVDYGETYSPVAKHTTVSAILSLAATFDWPLPQLDVNNTFLHSTLAEEIYMSQPPGFVNETYTTHICQLHNKLMDLNKIHEHGMRNSNLILFYMHFSTLSHITFCLYVINLELCSIALSMLMI